jgi:ABC-2 type transport system permease protein
MKAIKKLIVANFKQFFRDKTAVFFTFAFPLVFIVLFGWVFSDSDSVNYDIGLVNNDQSPIGEGITEAIENVPIFSITEGELNESLASLEEGELTAVIVIPADIATTIGSGQTASLILYYDPSQTQTSQIVLPVLRQVVDEISHQMTQAPILLTLVEESILSSSLRFIDFFVPGILAMSIMMSGLFGVVPLIEWREKKVLKRLGVTPLSRSTVVISQVVFRLALAVVQAVILLGVAYWMFDVQIIGSWLFLLGLVMMGTMMFISLGYVVAARVQTVEGAMPIINLITFPMMFLSGVFFPIDMMPDFIRPIIEILPLTYLADSFRQVMVEAAPFHPMMFNVIVMGAWLIICMGISIRFFRWE